MYLNNFNRRYKLIVGNNNNNNNRPLMLFSKIMLKWMCTPIPIDTLQQNVTTWIFKDSQSFAAYMANVISTGSYSFKEI